MCLGGFTLDIQDKFKIYHNNIAEKMDHTQRWYIIITQILVSC